MQIVVFESHSRWTARISHWLAARRKALGRLSFRLVRAGDGQEVFQALRKDQASVVCWVVHGAEAQQIVPAIRYQRREFPRSLPIVVGPAATTAWQPLLVLAGAAWVGDGPHAVLLFGKLITKHASMQPRAAPDHWWEEDLPALPWQEVATLSDR
ncbi:MAG: hypothetical protein KatS3mg110_1180 [Pirellulaceae bacterium]|nr:MAG: hypothetical protein KatS3mg110_1180 [Pirellulaceae bacterium]